MNTIGQRIKALRKHLKLTQIEFGEKIGVSDAAISNYEKGGNVPEYAIKLICYEFSIRREWLLAGEGRPFADLTSANIDKYLDEINCTGLPADFVKTFLNLDYDLRNLACKALLESWEKVQRRKRNYDPDELEEKKHELAVDLQLEPPPFPSYEEEEDEGNEQYIG